MISILISIFVLGILVAVHEGGHFVAARLMKVNVEKFSIGFGPKLFGFFRNGTEFVISLIPLGGYVKMQEENPGETKDLDEFDKQFSFTEKRWYQRAFIAFAGPFVNFIFAVILLIFSFWVGKNYYDQPAVVGKVNTEYEAFFQPNDVITKVNGKDVKGWSQIIQNLKDDENVIELIRDGQPQKVNLGKVEKIDFYKEILPKVEAVVGEASVGLPAYQAGLQAGDKIIAINGELVEDWYEMQKLISSSKGDQLEFLIKRGKQEFSKTIKLQNNMVDDRKIIGITQMQPIKIEEDYSFWESTKYGSLSAVNFVALNYAMLGKLLVNPSELKNSVGGPVMLYSMSKQTAKKGFSDILSFIGALNLILMVMNLLPIPVLDGGQILFCLIEGIRKKALAEKTQIVLQNIGFVFLMMLMLFAFWNDITKMFERNNAVKKQETQQLIDNLIKDKNKE